VNSLFLVIAGFCRSSLEHGIDELRKESPATLLEVVFPGEVTGSFPICQYRDPQRRLQKLPTEGSVGFQSRSQRLQWLSNPVKVTLYLEPGERLSYDGIPQAELRTQGLIIDDPIHVSLSWFGQRCCGRERDMDSSISATNQVHRECAKTLCQSSQSDVIALELFGLYH